MKDRTIQPNRIRDLTPKRMATWPVYQLFGLRMASDFPFATPLIQEDGEVDLVFTCVNQSPLGESWTQEAPVYHRRLGEEENEAEIALYHFDELDVLRLTAAADFYLWPDRIYCQAHKPNAAYLIEIGILGIVFALWLEERGSPALHASACVVEEKAVAFLSSNQGGKSTLTAAMMQAGMPLLTDDLLPVERTEGAFFGRPGYPAMRMWPEQVKHFVGNDKGFETVHPLFDKRRVPVGIDGFGTFHATPQALGCIYVPERRDPQRFSMEITFKTIPPGEAVIELVRHSFVASIVQALNDHSTRLSFFSSLLQQAPLRRVIYPEGFEHLPLVREAILEDLAHLQIPSEGS